MVVSHQGELYIFGWLMFGSFLTADGIKIALLL